MAAPLWLRVVSVVCSFVPALVGSSLALSVATLSARWMHFCNAAAAGVLIGVSLLHMLPENAEVLNGVGESVASILGGEEAPVGNVLCGLGFFFIVALEQAMGPHDHEAGKETGTMGMHDHEAGKETGKEMLTSDSDSETTEQRGVCRAAPGLLAGLSTLLGISMHSCIEGVATGAARSTKAVTMLTGAVLLHKAFSGFAVGSALQSVANRQLWWSLVLLFAISGPFGMMLGAGFQEVAEETGTAALQCFASGTLLSIGITHMLMPSLEDGHGTLERLSAAMVTYVGMAYLSVLA